MGEQWYYHTNKVNNKNQKIPPPPPAPPNSPIEKLADCWLKAKSDMISMTLGTETPFGNNHHYF